MSAWTTQDEIAYIERIGRYGLPPMPPVSVLLQNHIDAAKQRKAWGDIDRHAAMICAYRELLKEAGIA